MNPYLVIPMLLNAEPTTPPPTSAITHPRVETQSKSVREWLDLLLKVPSHYCQVTSKKTFVKITFFSNRRMHKIYEKWYNEQEKKSNGSAERSSILALHILMETSLMGSMATRWYFQWI